MEEVEVECASWKVEVESVEVVMKELINKKVLVKHQRILEGVLLSIIEPTTSKIKIFLKYFKY